jgi:tetratricopeptide (TPR) repeat protein
MAEVSRAAVSRIFISYRRDDSIAHVNGLFLPLREHFGKDRIFKDTDNIPPGKDFRKVIEKQLRSCSVLLAVIGKNWLTAQRPKTTLRRLDDPNDYLRVEVATALGDEGVLVIPILVGQATMPAPEELPPDLAPLSYLNAFELRDSRWESDIKLLIDAIEHAELAPRAEPDPSVLPMDSSVDHAPAPEPPVVDQPSDDLDLLELRRRRQIAEHMRTAQEAFEAQQYELVLEACEKVVWLDAQHTEARETRRRARAALEAQKIAGWLAEANELMHRPGADDAQLALASGLIDQALALQSTHALAMQRRQELLGVRKQRERQRDIDRHVQAAIARAQESLEEEEYDAAIGSCDDALLLAGDSAAARELRAKAVAAKAEQQRVRELRRRAQKAADQARTEFAAGQHEAAIARLEQFGGPHELVTVALTELRTKFEAIVRAREKEAREAAEREQKARAANVQQLIAAALTSVDAHDFDGAVATLQHADGLARLSPPIEALVRDVDAARSLVETHRADRARAIADALSHARAHLEAGNLEDAIRSADEALALDAVSDAAQQLRLRAADALEQQRREREARERAAREEHERRQHAIANALQRAQAAIDRGDYETASHSADEALALDPTDDAALPLKRRAADALAAQREARERAAREEAERRRHAIEAERARQNAEAEEKRRLEDKAREEKAATERAAAIAAAIEKTQGAQRERALREGGVTPDAAVRSAAGVIAAGPATALRIGYRSRAVGVVIAASIAIVAVAWFALSSRREVTPVAERSAIASPPSAARPGSDSPPAKPEPITSEGPPPPTRTPDSTAVRAASDPPRTEAPSIPEPPRVNSPVASQLAQLRDRARTQYRAGQRQQALDAAVAGLKLDANDPDLRRTLRSLETDAQSAMQKAKQEASAAQASLRASMEVNQAADKEAEAAALLRTNRRDDAIRSLWAAADHYSRAADRARQIGSQLESATARARIQLQAGRRTQALETAVDGFSLDPAFAPLHEVVNAIWKDAQASVGRSKQQAVDRGAGLSVPEFQEAVRREAEAAKLRDANNPLEAVKQLWAANDLFARAAAARSAPGRSGASPAPTEPRVAPETPKPALPKPSPSAEEQVGRVLEEYEAAYERLDTAAVNRLHPSVSREQWARMFGDYRSLSMTIANPRISISGDSAVVTCTITTSIRPRAGTPQQFTTQTTFRLQKQGDSWVIIERR